MIANGDYVRTIQMIFKGKEKWKFYLGVIAQMFTPWRPLRIHVEVEVVEQAYDFIKNQEGEV